LFEALKLGERVQWVEGDIRDGGIVRRAVSDHRPEVVFHLAAQPLVRTSYEAPIDTFETNVLGTVNVLDALRDEPAVRAAVVVTTDKCYENQEWAWPYRETDAIGGHDPYSGSKACAEIATSAYYRSFFQNRGVGIATARAGNVIGGGDWARDRLLPDIVRSLVRGESAPIRCPDSVRPWQHVLEPLGGYMQLAERLHGDPAAFSQAYNFGPDRDSARSVSELADIVCQLWGGGSRWHIDSSAKPHEARLLAVDASKAHADLGWRPRLGLRDALARTLEWYQAFGRGDDVVELSLRQIRAYEETVR